MLKSILLQGCHVMSSTTVTSLSPTRKRRAWRKKEPQLQEEDIKGQVMSVSTARSAPCGAAALPSIFLQVFTFHLQQRYVTVPDTKKQRIVKTRAACIRKEQRDKPEVL
jgi:hypothetical protein